MSKEALTQTDQLKSTIEKRLPSSVDFMLLGSCNLRCPFCYGPEHSIPPMETDTVISLLETFSDHGTKRVVFAGGEPTLVKDLPLILDFADESGLTTVLSTNGIRLKTDRSLFDDIAPRLDWIGLPLDGDNPEVNSKMRVGLNRTLSMEHFNTIIELIQTIRLSYPDLKIKLGTVVSNLNLESIIGIPDVLVNNNTIPDTWKLYQVSPSEYGKINYPQLEISNEEFNRVFEDARSKALSLGFHNIIRYSNMTRPGKYLFINPMGEALVVHPETNDYYSIGNVLRDFNEVLETWHKHVDNFRLAENFDDTYPDL